MAKMRPDQAEGLRRMFAADAAHMVALLGDAGQDIATGLAIALAALGKKVLLLDEHLAKGEEHPLLATPVSIDIGAALRSEVSLQEVAIPVAGIMLLPAGFSSPAPGNEAARIRLISAFHSLAGMYDIVLIHASISAQRRNFGFALAAPEVIALCKGTSSGITAAYSQIKSLVATAGKRRFRLLFRGVDESLSKILFRNLLGVCRQHLNLSPEYAGFLPEDSLAAADALEEIAMDMSDWPLPERDDSRFEAFMKRLLSATASRRSATTEQ